MSKDHRTAVILRYICTAKYSQKFKDYNYSNYLPPLLPDGKSQV